MYGLSQIVQAIFDQLRTHPATSSINWRYGRRTLSQADKLPIGIVTGLDEGGRDTIRTIPGQVSAHQGQFVVVVSLLFRDERGPEFVEPSLLDAIDAVLEAVAANPTLGLPNVLSVQPDPGGWTGTSNPENGTAEAEVRFVVQMLAL